MANERRITRRSARRQAPQDTDAPPTNNLSVSQTAVSSASDDAGGSGLGAMVSCTYHLLIANGIFNIYPITSPLRPPLPWP